MLKVIVGLGNPGPQYETTRHNAGFMAIDAYAKMLGLTWEESKKFKAQIAQGADIILIKPRDFMNNSGVAVAAVMAYYKLLPKKFGVLNVRDADLSENLAVIHDELDIPLGKFKISIGSRSAGHNGVQSIIDRLKTKNFKRLRIGIKPLTENKSPADSARSPRCSYGEAGRNEAGAAKYVLQKFKPEELKIIKTLIPKILSELK